MPRKSTPTPEVVGTKRNPGSNNSVPRKSSYTPTGRPRGRPAKNRPNANAAASSSTSKKTSSAPNQFYEAYTRAQRADPLSTSFYIQRSTTQLASPAPAHPSSTFVFPLFRELYGAS